LVTDLFFQLIIYLFRGLRGRYSSDIDHALVNSSMLGKISSAYFSDFPSIFDQRPLGISCKKTTADESFLLPKKKKIC